jgi:hypothetical protein
VSQGQIHKPPFVTTDVRRRMQIRLPDTIPHNKVRGSYTNSFTLIDIEGHTSAGWVMLDIQECYHTLSAKPAQRVNRTITTFNHAAVRELRDFCNAVLGETL